MKKLKWLIPILLVMVTCISCVACGPRDYVLNENTFFMFMTNMQYFPEQYLKSNIEFDCFTYELKDVHGNSYMCGVRKCSSGYGCACGNDTIIGFVLEYDGELPAPRNQSEDTNDKTWVHLSGKIKSADKIKIEIKSYLPDGSENSNKNEFIEFLVFSVDSLELIEDYSNLNYYVTD